MSKKIGHKNRQVEEIHALLNEWLRTLPKDSEWWDGVYCSQSHVAYMLTVSQSDSFVNWLDGKINSGVMTAKEIK